MKCGHNRRSRNLFTIIAVITAGVNENIRDHSRCDSQKFVATTEVKKINVVTVTTQRTIVVAEYKPKATRDTNV